MTVVKFHDRSDRNLKLALSMVDDWAAQIKEAASKVGLDVQAVQTRDGRAVYTLRDEAGDVVVDVADELDIVDMAEAVQAYMQRRGETLREIAAEVIDLHHAIDSGMMVPDTPAP